LTTKEYPNGVRNSTGALYALPHTAFVCGKDTAASVRQRLIEFGCPLVGVLILSPRDNRALDSLEAVIEALPCSIRLLIVDDIEYLVPPDKRDPASVMDVLFRLNEWRVERNIQVATTTGIDLSAMSQSGDRNE
jgi:hypothetical protein